MPGTELNIMIIVFDCKKINQKEGKTATATTTI